MVNLTFNYETLLFFLLIFVRVTGFVAVAPFIGGTNTGVNQIARIGFSFMLSIMLLPVVPLTELNYNSVAGYAVIVIREVFVGIVIGFAAQVCMQATSFAGQIADMMTGLSMATTMDPTSGESVTITATMYNQVIMVMMIISGMYRYLIAAVADSYQWIPVNGAVMREDLFMSSLLDFMKDFFVIGFRVALPVFIVTFVVNMVLGVLAKVAPQMNMFSVGIQIKILVGYVIMFFSCSMLGSASGFIMRTMRTLMTSFVSSMSP